MKKVTSPKGIQLPDFFLPLIVVQSIWTLKFKFCTPHSATLVTQTILLIKFSLQPNKKLYNPLPPLNTKVPSATLVLPYNILLKQYQRIMKSSLNTKLLYKYNNKIARSLVKNSPAPLGAEGGVCNVSCLECSINIMVILYNISIPGYLNINMVSPGLSEQCASFIYYFFT